MSNKNKNIIRLDKNMDKLQEKANEYGKIFVLAMTLANLYRESCDLLKNEQLPCKSLDPNHPEWNGPREYSPNKKYVGLSEFQHLMETDEWKEAHQLLVDWNIIEQDPKWKYHYKYVGPTNIADMFTIDVGPFCPYQLKNKHNKFMESSKWQQIKEEVIKRDEGKCVDCGKPFDHVHHNSNDAYYYEDTDRMLLSDFSCLCSDCHNKRHHNRFNGQ